MSVTVCFFPAGACRKAGASPRGDSAYVGACQSLALPAATAFRLVPTPPSAVSVTTTTVGTGGGDRLVTTVKINTSVIVTFLALLLACSKLVHVLSMYSPTPVIRTSVIRNLDYPNGVPNVESV